MPDELKIRHVSIPVDIDRLLREDVNRKKSNMQDEILGIVAPALGFEHESRSGRFKRAYAPKRGQRAKRTFRWPEEMEQAAWRRGFESDPPLNMNEVIVVILAAHYGIDYTPNHARRPVPGSGGRPVAA